MAQNRPKRLTPKAEWEDGCFGSPHDTDQQSILQRAHLSKLPDLREVLLPPGDIEVRLWAGFGMALLQGFYFQTQERQLDGDPPFFRRAPLCGA